jgi:translation initiation factor IF-3
LGILPVEQGLELARQHELDLVEVAAKSLPPVCRIMDYSKYKYDQAKKEREARKQQKKVCIKEIRVKPKIEEHDYQVKLSHLIRFLKRGDKVKITLFFRGREISHIELGRRILDRFANDISEIAEAEKKPFLEGRLMTMVVAPK